MHNLKTFIEKRFYGTVAVDVVHVYYYNNFGKLVLYANSEGSYIQTDYYNFKTVTRIFNYDGSFTEKVIYGRQAR